MRQPMPINRMINPRGCPGSYATVNREADGKGVCPFCGNIYRVSNAGMIRAHPRPR